MAHGRRFFLYCQHMAGTGHFFRTYEIAQALAEQHDVYLVDGGRPIPRPASVNRLTLVPLPRIYRSGQIVSPFESDCKLDEVMHQRQKALLLAIEKHQPDVLMIEHFPFRRWELYAEIVALIQRARALNRRVKVVCSLRDIPGTSRFYPPSEQHDLEVLETLHEYFDQLLVHTDPCILRLEEQTPLASKINIPFEYTGYVSQSLNGWKRGRGTAPAERNGGTVIVSAGGTGSMAILACAMDAWNLLVSENATGGRTLLVFLPLSVKPENVTILQRQARNNPIRLVPYTTDFLRWMQTADLSISHSGYNTCTNLLETRTRAILIPNLESSDQHLRAHRLDELGLAVTIDPAELTPERLACAIRRQLQAPAPEHSINLNGTAATRHILDRLLAGVYGGAATALQSVGR